MSVRVLFTIPNSGHVVKVVICWELTGPIQSMRLIGLRLWVRLTLTALATKIGCITLEMKFSLCGRKPLNDHFECMQGKVRSTQKALEAVVCDYTYIVAASCATTAGGFVSGRTDILIVYLPTEASIPP